MSKTIKRSAQTIALNHLRNANRTSKVRIICPTIEEALELGREFGGWIATRDGEAECEWFNLGWTMTPIMAEKVGGFKINPWGLLDPNNPVELFHE